jgi:O-methyltransferase
MTGALQGVWDRLLPGGVIVADDCSPHDHRWDGALQAYNEFIAKVGLPHEIRTGKLGILRKPADADKP